ncbi:hypothetical protein DRN74_01105 [Candidatus Micrarchaeota archaeon]|nr:MAG: hypothetical protein DRN74_01105 [Candidatus Micrarchaeota archaeon]
MPYLLRDLKAFLKTLIKEHIVIAPVKEKNHYDYKVLESEDEFHLDYVNTLYPPKKFLLPYEENLLLFSKRDGEFSAKPLLNKTKRVLFGVRPCDVHGIAVMDRVFLSGNYVDSFYESRRKNTIIIAIECEKAGENCYCESFGTYKVESGYDLLLTPVDDGFIVRVGSDEGKKLINELFEETDRDEHKYPKSKTFKKEKLAKMEKYFHDELWKTEAEKCLSCAACTIACPTCTCFTIEDEVQDPETGYRKRRWASCQLKDFTEVAGGMTFRKETYKKLRHFAYHKLYWSIKQYGLRMCIGCGRCIDTCPVNINIFDIVNRLGEE